MRWNSCRLQAEQSRQRALVEQQLLAPTASELVLQGHIHLSANAAEVGRACTDLLGHVMSTVSNFWPFATGLDPASSGCSTLNPNARSFTPFALNPDAKEFTPQQGPNSIEKNWLEFRLEKISELYRLANLLANLGLVD